MFSIDQNCHSLWDALPKLQALARRGLAVDHFVEDIDVAFTALGSALTGPLRLARERYHHSGGADWGAALFYCQFLGRLPADPRDWEAALGMKVPVLARQLGRTVQDLYQELSPGDNWQLIGPSYVGDRLHHRVVGDLSVAETAPFLRELLRTAQADMTERFVLPEAQARLGEWFAKETHLLEDLLAVHAGGRLVDLYRGWLERYLGQAVRVDLTSSLFALGAAGGSGMLETFLRDRERAADLYNQALADSGSKLHPLDPRRGELPFFAVLQYQGHTVRSEVLLDRGSLIIADRAFPLADGRQVPTDALRAAGVRCLAGKAVVLVIQARLGQTGQPLALPYHGSIYMPAANRLAQLLAERGLLPGRLHPVVRVRFHLLDRMQSLRTTIRLPPHLAAAFGREEVLACDLAAEYPLLARQAAQRLEAMKDPPQRSAWQRQAFPDLARQIDQVQRRRRELARTDPKGAEIRQLWQHHKRLLTSLLEATLRQVARDWQVSQVDYWDSRGALLPWAVALGGEEFYNELIARAEIYQEPTGGCKP